MAIYSHSKLSTFEQCRYKYKLRYIDKIKPDIEKSIESHLGTSIHDSLEWLYNEVLKGITPELDELIQEYANLWQKGFNENFLIVKKEFTAEDYFNKGVKFLIDYFVKHQPFKDGTLEMEKRVFIELHPDSEHKIIGYIDRLVYDKEKNQYEVHDYKTANSLPNQEKFEQDRQLALYSIAIKQIHGEHIPVILTWHYLSHNMQIFSKRTNEQLNQLKQDTLKLIHKVEQTKEFPTKKSVLCGWCEYKSMCPLFNKTTL
ncbi:PD-(D/E)XK nuclease family protein [archaeon]|jgi:putative RecB family exonuclease|nr:PD-(D/E)XK nuclease family protein [archaeon]